MHHSNEGPWVSRRGSISICIINKHVKLIFSSNLLDFWLSPSNQQVDNVLCLECIYQTGARASSLFPAFWFHLLLLVDCSTPEVYACLVSVFTRRWLNKLLNHNVAVWFCILYSGSTIISSSLKNQWIISWTLVWSFRVLGSQGHGCISSVRSLISCM